MTDVVIASAARTPIGAFNGALSSVAAHYLGQTAIGQLDPLRPPDEQLGSDFAAIRKCDRTTCRLDAGGC